VSCQRLCAKRVPLSPPAGRSGHREPERRRFEHRGLAWDAAPYAGTLTVSAQGGPLTPEQSRWGAVPVDARPLPPVGIAAPWGAVRSCAPCYTKKNQPAKQASANNLVRTSIPEIFSLIFLLGPGFPGSTGGNETLFFFQAAARGTAKRPRSPPASMVQTIPVAIDEARKARRRIFLTGDGMRLLIVEPEVA